MTFLPEVEYALEMLVIPSTALERFELVTRFNSPYVAHDRGRAVDLYPPTGQAPSPVAGTVLEHRTVETPSRPYAAPTDHLLLIRTEAPRYRLETDQQAIARVMHVKPTVSVGEHVSVGDTLGQPIRSGFFAPWVDNHLHVGFRRPDANLIRASGSLPLSLDIEVDPLRWDGTGVVREVGETFVMLDAPTHPAPGDRFVGIGSANAGVVLDGGLPHFERGGTFGRSAPTVQLLGATFERGDDGTFPWADRTIRVNGDPVLGLSLFAARTDRFGARIICPDRTFEVGEKLTVTVA